MTEVEKVSIGGYAFTLEVEAYAIVKQYLDELEAHYSKREGGAEIMEGIEERMAELLYEKCGDTGVASVADAQNIIGVLGKPSAIEGDNDPDEQKESVPGDTRREGKKRLYREPTGKMLAGVCSGLAAYFKMDVVWVRLIFVGLFVAGIVLGDKLDFFEHMGPLVVLGYLALWIAMPEAKTVQQRWEMGVTNPPASAGKPSESNLGRVLRIIIGCLLLLIGVAGLTAGLAAIFSQHIFNGWFLSGFWADILEEMPAEMIPLWKSGLLKVLLLLLYFLPMVGMLYAGIVLLFDMKTPSWHPGLVLFLLWVVVLVVFSVLSIIGMVNTVLP